MVLLTLNGHSAEVTNVAFSPDGRRLASGSETVKLWHATILTPDEKMARWLVRGLFDELANPDEVIRAIEQKTNWNDGMRNAALGYVRRRAANALPAQPQDVSP